MFSNLATYNNSWYSKEIGASKLKQAVWYFLNVLLFINPLFPFSSFKVKILRLFGAKIGTGVVMKPGVNIKYPWKLSIGNYCWVGENVWIDNLANVSIGEHVCISQGAMILTGNHNYTKPSFDLIVKPIILENGTWVGAKSVVCPGVTMFSHAVLAVMSVASKDLESFSIYQGNPAVKVKVREIL